MEVGLRVAGYGYSTKFFRPLRIGQEDYLVENDKFGLRFFPPSMARSPAPVVMKAKKAPGSIRIFILGESAALGDPRPAYGAGRYLQMMLKNRFPGMEFEVVNVAMTAINSHTLLPIARECAQHEGDIWIVYMGNNEMVGPFGAITIFGKKSPPLSYVRLGLAIQKMRLGQLLMALARKLGGKKQATEGWEGMKMFTENRLAADDKSRQVVYSNFDRNLQDILRAGRDCGVHIILNSVAVNLKDCSPFASLPSRALTTDQSQAFQHLLQDGTSAEKQTNYGAAIKAYEQATALDPHFADSQFQLGECLLRETNATAGSHFQQACDFDALPFRADSTINKLLSDAAREHAGPILAWVDAAALFATNSPVGVTGQEAFFEHVHFNFNGNYHLARAWADQVEHFLPQNAPDRARGSEWETQEACESQLGLTDWNRVAVISDVLRRLRQPPFIDQANHAQQVAALRAELSLIRSRMDTNAAARTRDVYLQSIKNNPSDHRVHENFAEFLEDTGDLQAAVVEWRKVRDLLPHHHLGYFECGRLLLRLNELPEAESSLHQALDLRPDLAEAWLELGNLHSVEGKPELALKEYARERDLAPQDYRVYYHEGKALSKLNQRARAIEDFRHALELRPDYWEARYALGEELAFGGNVQEARRHFEEVIRIRPNYAMAHFNLGVSLVQQGQLDEALNQFNETIRLDPDNKLATQYAEKVRTMKEKKH